MAQAVLFILTTSNLIDIITTKLGDKMVFVFDLDDTISDTDGYSEKYIRNFFAEHNLPYKQIAKNVRFAESKFDWDRQTALAWYKEFGDEMMSNFPLKQWARDFLDFLHNQGHTIIIATARATDWHTNPEEVTLRWLKNNNIHYDKIYIGRNDKEAICLDENADVFVDDDLKITANVAKAFEGQKDKQVFLQTTAYNKDFEVPNGVQRIKNFNDLLMSIQKSRT